MGQSNGGFVIIRRFVYKSLLFTGRQRLWLRLGVNVDDQLWLRLNPIPIPNCNPSANPSPSPIALTLTLTLTLNDPRRPS